MILSGFFAIVASLLYFFALSLLFRRIKLNSTKAFRVLLIKVVSAAALFHLASLAPKLIDDTGIHFNLMLALSFISLGAVVSLLITNINKNTGILGIFIFPFAVLTTLIHNTQNDNVIFSYALGSHILISVMAYSVLGLAAAQAILYSQQEKRFQKRQLSSLFKALPPLQVMESILVQLTLIGFGLLSFALLSGIFFIEDMFAQHLIHKTFFSILSWFVYATFIYGHFKKGWRGQTAAKYTLWAYVLLLLSYLGTQVILSFLY